MTISTLSLLVRDVMCDMKQIVHMKDLQIKFDTSTRESSYFINLVGLQLSVSTLKCYFLSAQIHLCSAYLFFHRFSTVLSFF